MTRARAAPPPKSIRVAAYCRQSVADELTFSSVDAQRLAVASYVSGQPGWSLLDEHYDDTGFSGATTDRPAFRRLLADVEAGLVDVLAVYAIDRLSRSILDFAQLVQFLEKRGVRFVSTTQAFDTSTPHGQLTLNVLMSFAQFERQMIAQRTRDKMAASRRRGQYTGGKPPLGYRLIEKKLVVDPDEAEVVREIFELFSRLKRVAHVTAEMNRRGRITKRHRARNGGETGGEPFDREVVRRILTNAVYIGRVAYGGELHAGQHAAIVDERIWAAAQELLAGGRHENRPRRYQVALLRGLLHCSKCGEPMRPEFTRKGSRRYPFYVCATLKKRGADACPGSRVAAHTIEDCVAEQVRVIGRDPKLVAEVARQLPRDVDPDDLRDALARFDPLWDALTTAERAELLQQLVERIEFDGESGEVVVRFQETGLAGLGEETAA